MASGRRHSCPGLGTRVHALRGSVKAVGALRGRQQSPGPKPGVDAGRRAPAEAGTNDRQPPTENCRILECFKLFDRNNDGKISREELGTVLRSLDPLCHFSGEDLQGVIDEVDTSNDGSIDYAEFTAWLKKEPKVPAQVTTCVFRKQTEEMVEEGTPQVRLERCQSALRKAELAAVPPKPIEATLTEGDLWFFTKKGERLEDARASKEATTVHQISPTSNAFHAGVRRGMLVVAVAGRSPSMMSSPASRNVMDQVVKYMGGGGGAVRCVNLQFMSPEVIQSHEEALRTLQKLLDDVEEARALCNKILTGMAQEGTRRIADGSTHGMQEQIVDKEASVSVTYFNSQAFFPIPEGRLAAAEIDVIFQISRVMPKCNLYLATKGYGDEHIRTAAQINAQELDLAKLQGSGSAGATFIDLEPGRAYFLIVDPGSYTSDADREWRARMQKVAHEERIADLPAHDCYKERIPFGIRVSTTLGEFEIEIDNRDGHNLGLNVEADTDDKALRVEDISNLGLMCIWNTLHPDMVVKHGDRIMEINGVRDTAEQLMTKLKSHDILRIRLRRVDFAIGDQVLGLFHNGCWEKASVVQDNRDATFTLQWFDGREEDRIKGPFELKKEHELLHVCHTRVNGDYWFIGSHNGRAMYKNSGGAVASFHNAWRINFSEESSVRYYSAVGETGLCPPRVSWPSPANPGRFADISYFSGKVCRLCTLPFCQDVAEA